MEFSWMNIVIGCEIFIGLVAACCWVEQAIKYHFQKKINDEVISGVLDKYKEAIDELMDSIKR